MATEHDIPHRLAVQKAMAELLAAACGCTVFRGKIQDDKDDPSKAISILESGDMEDAPVTAGRNGYEAPTKLAACPLVLKGWTEDDPKNPTDAAHYLRADILKALATVQYRGDPEDFSPTSAVYNFGGLITGLDVEACVVRPPDTEVKASRAYCFARIVVSMVEDPNNPYLY